MKIDLDYPSGMKHDSYKAGYDAGFNNGQPGAIYSSGGHALAYAHGYEDGLKARTVETAEVRLTEAGIGHRMHKE